MEALYTVMLQRMEDQEFVLQTAASSHQLLLQEPTRAALLAHPEVVARFTELLHHANREVGRSGGAQAAGRRGLHYLGFRV